MKRLLPFALLTLAAGCGGVPDGPPLLASIETSYLFDTVLGPPSKHMFYFENMGGGTTGTLMTSLSGDVAQFTITGDQCSGASLQHGKRCGVEVQLAGDVAAGYAGQLHVGSADDEVAVDLSGQVGPSKLVVMLPTNTSVALGGTAQAVVTISNGGGAQSGVLTTVDPNHVVVTDSCNGTAIEGGASCKVTVMVTSLLTDESSTDDAQLTVDEAAGATLAIDVPFKVGLAKAPTSSDGEFGAQLPSDNPIKSFDIYPDQNPVSQIQMTWGSGENDHGTSPFVITKDACTGMSVAVGSGCTVLIGIDPTLPAPADYTAQLVIKSLGRQPLTVPLHVHTTVGHVNLMMGITGAGGYFLGPLAYYCGGQTGPCGSIEIGDGAPTTFQAGGTTTSSFVRWTSGPCAGSTDSICTVTPSGADIALSAELAPQ
ncbi:MAG TPA: hypothetical protein VIA18_21105 [Polyangia bacterium]|nr:hypothetical protein [Polyangia bacterium]